MNDNKLNEDVMNETDNKIMQTFGKLVPKLSEIDKIFLLGFSEGLSVHFGENQKNNDTPQIVA